MREVDLQCVLHRPGPAALSSGPLIVMPVAVTPAGRPHGDTPGLWSDHQAAELAEPLRRHRVGGTRVGLELTHAGRRAHAPEGDLGADVVGASGRPFGPGARTPRRLRAGDLPEIVLGFASAAARAVDLGADVVMVNAADGHLLHEFLSPLGNDRDDDFGGSAVARARLLRAVAVAVREAVDGRCGLLVRLTVDDRARGGLRPVDSGEIVSGLLHLGCDGIELAAGGLGPPTSTQRRPRDLVPLARQLAGRTRTGCGPVPSRDPLGTGTVGVSA